MTTIKVIFALYYFGLFLTILIGGSEWSMVVLLCAGIGIYLYSKAKLHLEKQFYANLIDNIYVVGMSPSGQEVVIPSVIEKCVIHSRHDKVHESANRQRKYIIESGNPLFFATVPSSHRLDVKELVFRDAGYVNESWEEYSERVIDYIKQDRIVRHTLLQTTNDEWYSKHGNGQRFESWKIN